MKDLSLEEMAELRLLAIQAAVNPMYSEGKAKTGEVVLSLIAMISRRDRAIEVLQHAINRPPQNTPLTYARENPLMDALGKSRDILKEGRDE